jgi:glycosyltransferase involved in cell wall biosynthesis
VIIPTYNAARYLPTAVDSALGQTFADCEVVVVDDGSTDDTESVMRRFRSRVRYLRQPNRGVAAARNRGIACSRGRYVAFLDADDAWLPRKLERQIHALIAAGRSCRACYTAYTVVTLDQVPLRVHRSEQAGLALEALLSRGNVIGTPSTVLAERGLFQEVGGFDPALSQCADWDMWIRLATRTEFCYLDEPLTAYRQHDANMSRNVPLLESDSRLVLDKGFALPGLGLRLRARRREALARNFMVLAGSYFRARHHLAFIRCLCHSLTLDPRQLGYLLAFPFRAATRILNNRAAADVR